MLRVPWYSLQQCNQSEIFRRKTIGPVCHCGGIQCLFHHYFMKQSKDHFVSMLKGIINVSEAMIVVGNCLTSFITLLPPSPGKLIHLIPHFSESLIH